MPPDVIRPVERRGDELERVLDELSDVELIRISGRIYRREKDINSDHWHWIRDRVVKRESLDLSHGSLRLDRFSDKELDRIAVIGQLATGEKAMVYIEDHPDHGGPRANWEPVTPDPPSAA